MDLGKIIQELTLRRQLVARTIAKLEAEQGDPVPILIPTRRGRKSMGSAERLVVSERMKRYWNKKRGKASDG